MARQAEIWQWLAGALESGQAVALLVVVDSRGSSPGKPGAKMAVTADSCCGTIGGGPGEFRLVNQARTLLSDASLPARLFELSLHPSPTGPMPDGLCGGQQTVAIYRCRLPDRPLFEQILKAHSSGESVALSLSAAGLALAPAGEAWSGAGFVAGERWCYRELLGLRRQAYIIGGGHVGLALAKLLEWLDFELTVIDDREPAATASVAPHAWRRRQLDYRDIAEQVPEGANVFVFIMTANHHSDQLVVGQLAKKQFAYLGMLGSKRKVAVLKTRLAESLSEQQLRRLQAPMGLPIGSHTPEEIAVSIAAELIQRFNTRPGSNSLDQQDQVN